MRLMSLFKELKKAIKIKEHNWKPMLILTTGISDLVFDLKL